MGSLRDVHDRLLANRPEGARHDETACPFCLADSVDETATAGELALRAENTALKVENTALKRQLDDNLLDAARTAERVELEQRMAARATAAVDAGFPAAKLADHLERWAAMDDVTFGFFLESLAALPSAAPESRIPAHTALFAGRESAATPTNPMREMLELRQNGHRIDWSQFR